MELCTDYTLSPKYNIQRSTLCWSAAAAAFYLSFLASSCCLLSYMPKPYGTVTKPAAISRQTGHALKKTEKGGDDVPPMNVGTTRLL